MGIELRSWEWWRVLEDIWEWWIWKMVRIEEEWIYTMICCFSMAQKRTSSPPAPTFDYFLRDWVKIRISSNYILVGCWTVFCMRWDHDTSGPWVCPTQPCSVCEIIPRIGVFRQGNLLTRSWGGEEVGMLLKSEGQRGVLLHPSSHALGLALLCHFYRPFTHSPASALGEALQRLTLDTAQYKACTQCLPPPFLCPFQAENWPLSFKLLPPLTLCIPLELAFPHDVFTTS